MRCFALVALLVAISTATAADSATDRIKELDAYWAEVSRSVGSGDFPAYKATIHPDAVLVAGTSKRSLPLAEALKGWQKEFEATKAGKSKTSVEFRLRQRWGDATTAHESGIFLYKAIPTEGGKAVEDYVEFEALLIKRDGKWLILMEYQKSLTDAKAWDALGAK